MNQLTGQGIVIAFHCVSRDVEPAIEAFWKHLRTSLQAQGQELILVSTVQIHDPDLPHLGIPFYLPDFCNQQPSQIIPVNNELMIRVLQDWYKIPINQAKNVHENVMDFILRLLEALQPAAVLSWQGAHPMSRMVREICQSRDIAWWSTERGWIKDTLMFDLCDNNVLSEVNRSLIAKRTMANFQPPLRLLHEIRERVLESTSVARYPEIKEHAEASIRERLGLPSETPIWALFTHGEPHVNSLSPAVRWAHQMDSSELQKCVTQLSTALKVRGAVLIVREHPFNSINGRALDISGLSNVYGHDGDLDELINSADVGLFTLTTLQFEWALRKKPFGLLCRGLLSGKDLAPQWNEYMSEEEFIDDCLDMEKWTIRYKEIERRIAYLYESQLVDLRPDSLENSAQEIADLLVMHGGASLSVAINGLNSFIAHEDSRS